MDENQGVVIENPELQMLLNNKEDGYNYRERREDAWRENYELYRDHVIINRLTQRQSVNLPLMKTQLRTVLKDVDDMPVIVFENLDNDKEAEVFQNEHWKLTLEDNNAEIQDIVDKKQDFFYGRTFDAWQVKDGKIKFDITDTEDILIGRYMNPYDIDSSRFLIHTHIFKPLSSLVNNPEYDQDEVKKLVEFFQSRLGLIKAQDNMNSLQKKNQKMQELGVTDIDDPVLGETYVELTNHYVFRSNEKINGKTAPEQIFLYVEAEERAILSKKPQEELVGVTDDHYWRNHYRYNTWGDDVDKQDFWTDGLADIVRPSNKIVNVWFSQEVERRTLSNFGMHYYDTSIMKDGFTPSTFNPVPWGWYGVPGDPNKVLKKIDLPAEPGNLEFSTWLIQLVEKGTGATATQQGVQTATQTTLGEVQMAQGEAKARTQGMSKFYTKAWEQRATKYLKLIEAAADKIDAVKIYKKGRNTDNVFPREISPSDWMTKAGYKVRVWSQDEKKANDVDALNKLQNLRFEMFDNPKVIEIYRRKLAEYADLKPDEITEIMEYEKQKLLMPMQGGMINQSPQPGTQPKPGMNQQPQNRIPLIA